MVYLEADEGCGGVGGRMSVVFLLHQRQPFRSELPRRNKGDNWIGAFQIEINAVASLRDMAHFTQRLLVYRPVASATAGYIPGWNTDRALSVLRRCRKGGKLGVASMSPTTGLTSTRLTGGVCVCVGGGGGGGGGGRRPIVRNAITTVFMFTDSEPVRLYAQM